MTAVVDVDNSLASKCMVFCQALASQGQAFNFSLTVGPDFSFSLDTRSKAASQDLKKKASPSTLRRNAKRREDYLQQKRHPSSANFTEEVEVALNALSCDKCDYNAASEKGLRQHKRMKHGLSQLAPAGASNIQATPEKNRTWSSVASLAVSPSAEANRIIPCQDCENDDCSTHCCNIHKCGWCEKMFSNHDDLSDHMATVHPFMCHICHMDCVDYNGRFKHHNEIHIVQ